MMKDVPHDLHIGLPYSFVVITGDTVDIDYHSLVKERYPSSPIRKNNQLN